jgi:DNA-binding GntR family transcriptional regulator
MTTIASRIQQTLAEEIIKGELAPGQKLDEKALAERFSISRTPIREALKELAARGLIDVAPRRGCVVARIGVQRLADMLEAECELEAHCARLASQRMTGLDRGGLQELFQRSEGYAARGDHEAYLEYNMRLHDFICNGVHNDTLSDLVRNLRARLAPFRRTQPSEISDRLQRSHAEHELIVRAIVRGDGEMAYEAMRNHNGRLSTGVLLLMKQKDAQSARSSPVAATRAGETGTGTAAEPVAA